MVKSFIINQSNFCDLDIHHPIFDSLKEDYPNFSSWFLNKSDENIYTVYVQNELSAVLYLKIETGIDNSVFPPLKSNKKLKIGTFKVDKKRMGIGKSLMEKVFQEAFFHHVDEIYVTVHNKSQNHYDFISFIQKYGFVLHGHKGEELVFCKKLK